MKCKKERGWDGGGWAKSIFVCMFECMKAACVKEEGLHRARSLPAEAETWFALTLALDVSYMHNLFLPSVYGAFRSFPKEEPLAGVGGDDWDLHMTSANRSTNNRVLPFPPREEGPMVSQWLFPKKINCLALHTMCIYALSHSGVSMNCFSIDTQIEILSA
jgi:hypothetical protein